MAEERELEEEARRSREETRKVREEARKEPLPGEPWAKASSGDADRLADDED
jgi:hypothetical protein